MRGLACLACLFLLVVSSGCTPQNVPPPPTAKVTGKVTLDGKAMAEGEVHFSVMGQSPKICPIKDGAFSGEVFVGKNRVRVVLEKDGPPRTTDKKEPLKINTVAAKDDLEASVTEGGANAFTFEATSVVEKK